MENAPFRLGEGWRMENAKWKRSRGEWVFLGSQGDCGRGHDDFERFILPAADFGAAEGDGAEALREVAGSRRRSGWRILQPRSSGSDRLSSAVGRGTQAEHR